MMGCNSTDDELRERGWFDEPSDDRDTVPRMRIKPLHDRILVKPLDADQKTPGGLHIPDTAKERPVRGIVIAVGAGKRLADGTMRPLDVHEGDCVLFAKFGGTRVQVEGVEHIIMGEDDVMGTIEGDGSIDASDSLANMD